MIFTYNIKDILALICFTIIATLFAVYFIEMKIDAWRKKRLKEIQNNLKSKP